MGALKRTARISQTIFGKWFFFQRNEKSSCIDGKGWGGRRGAVRSLRSSQLCMLKILTSIVFRYIFAFIYTSEMFLKIIARGFVLNSYTYLRNPWNWLDFTVVIMGYVLFFISTQQYSLMFWRHILHHVPFRKGVVGYSCWNVARNFAGCTHTVFQTVTLICQIVFAWGVDLIAFAFLSV